MTAMQTTPGYVTWDTLAPGWDTSDTGWNKPVANRLVERAGIFANQTVLDVGCGAGAATIAAARATGNGLVTGVDSSPVMIRRAEAEAQAAGLRNVRFACQDAENLNVALGAFHAVIASMLVGYLPHPGETLHSWARLLYRGGTLAFSWVQHEDPMWVPVFDAADTYIPAENRWRAGRPRRDIPEMEALLPPGMWRDTTTQKVTTVYRDPGHFLASSWTQAPARHWTHIPLPLRDSAAEAMTALLAEMKQPDGTLHRHRLVCHTVARLDA